MMETLEGGQKDVSSIEGTTLKKSMDSDTMFFGSLDVVF